METITDFPDRCEADLISQYQGKPLMVSIVRAVGKVLQAVEDDRARLATFSTLGGSSGKWLANLEALVGAPSSPGATTDAERRARQGLVSRQVTIR